MDTRANLPDASVHASPRARGHAHGHLRAARPGTGPGADTHHPSVLQAFTAPLVYFPPLRRNFGGFGPWRHFTQVATRVDQLLVDAIVGRRRVREERDDILSVLLAARADDGRPITDGEVRDEVITLLLAGHETMAIALAWAFYWLHRQPDVLQRLQAELRAVGRPPSPDDLVQLPYLRAVCEEALRLYPVVGAITRRLLQPMTLCGYRLPAGIAVGAAPPLMHLDPTRYPEPQRFRPERFLERPYTPYEYLPFGGGARRCIGAAFAVAEMKIILGSLLALHRFGLAKDTPIPPVPRTFTIGPKGGVQMIYRGAAVGETVGESSGVSPSVGHSLPVTKNRLPHDA